jgi:uncharacterized protein (DUF736 family)
MIKNLLIFKNTYKKEGTKEPDYKVMIVEKEGENAVEVGAGWINEGKKGKFISCRLNDAYLSPDKKIAKKGFHLVEDENVIVPENPF